MMPGCWLTLLEYNGSKKPLVMQGQAVDNLALESFVEPVSYTHLLGIWLGLEQGLLCLLLAFVSGGVVGALLLLCRRGKLKQAIPFGPFLCAAAVAAYFCGKEIITWYWRMFL